MSELELVLTCIGDADKLIGSAAQATEKRSIVRWRSGLDDATYTECGQVPWDENGFCFMCGLLNAKKRRYVTYFPTEHVQLSTILNTVCKRTSGGRTDEPVGAACGGKYNSNCAAV